MSANPHANGGLLLRDLRLPDFRDYAVEVPKPGRGDAEATRVMGKFLRDVMKLNMAAQNFRALQPRREQLQSLAGRARSDEPRVDGGDRLPYDDHLAPDGRVMEDAQRAPVPGLARRLSAHRPPRLLLLLRGVHPHHRFDVQPARQVAEGVQPHSVAPADRLAELPADLARLAAGSQRLLPSGSRASSTMS